MDKQGATSRAARPPWWLAVVAIGCYSGASGPDDEGPHRLPDAAQDSDGEPEPDGEVPPQLQCEDGTVGRSPERLLTRSQVGNLLRDSYPGLSLPVEELVASLPDDSESIGFKNNASASITSLHTTELMNITEAVAEQVVADWGALGLGCEPSRECAGAYVATVGRRAWRRTLPSEQVEAMLEELYDPEPDFDAGITQLTMGLLLAGEALYQYEVGEPVGDGVDALTDLDLASKLSFFLWNTIPDDALLSAAEAGELRGDEGLRAQAERMLADPRAEQTLGLFHQQWLRLETGEPIAHESFENFGEHTFERSLFGLELFFGHLLREQGSFADLFTSNVAFVDDDVGAVYGVAPGSQTVPGHPGWTQVELDPQTRSGLITRVGFLAATSHSASTSPTIRGREIRSQILCTAIPDPPPDVQDMFPQLPTDPDKTTRERLEEVTSASAVCQGCHSQMDPLGLTLEHYDASGAWRDDENGLTIDTAVDTGVFGPQPDALALSEAIGDSDEAMGCYADFWYAFALLRSGTDECALADVQTNFAQSGGDLHTLLLDIVLSPGFRYRAS
ncbi:MAG: DUF1592 domain-containing protein [Myxococcota bacterium]